MKIILPWLVSYLQDTGYSAMYIGYVKKMAEWLSGNSDHYKWKSLADVEPTLKELWSNKYTCRNKVRLLRVICQYIENGLLPDGRKHYIKPHHYELLGEEYRNIEELKRFFDACDNIKPRRGMLAAIQRMTLPVFFRLLYSSGMRTTEAILLERNDVNLENGVVSIKRGKEYDQHYVVLPDTMLDLMYTYDREIAGLVSHRRMFFPTPDDRPHPPA